MRIAIVKNRKHGFSVLEAVIGVAVIAAGAIGIYGGLANVDRSMASHQAMQDSSAATQYLVSNFDCAETISQNSISCTDTGVMDIDLYTRDGRLMVKKNGTTFIGNDNVISRYKDGEIFLMKKKNGVEVDLLNGVPLYCQRGSPGGSQTYTNLYAYTMSLGNVGGGPSIEILPGLIQGGKTLSVSGVSGVAIHRVRHGNPEMIKNCPDQWTIGFKNAAGNTVFGGGTFVNDLPRVIPASAVKAYLGFLDAPGAFFDNEPARQPDYGSTNGCTMTFEVSGGSC